MKKIKITIHYTIELEDVDKIIAHPDGWDNVEFFYKEGLLALPRSEISEIEILED